VARSGDRATTGDLLWQDAQALETAGEVLGSLLQDLL
jgi:hypothetical protein